MRLHQLIHESNLLDEFLHTKFQTVKRYGLEGQEGTIVALNAIIEQAAANGVEHVIIGTAHRGRFNMLVNLLEYDPVMLMAEFADTAPMLFETGDVMYHLSTTCHKVINGQKIEISLLPNPSHLEAVDPVVNGYVSALGKRLGDKNKVLAIQIHGDAALCGQGVVYETM
jgi:2-oxoglutarate dehydrogenase E1 component